MSAGLPDKLDPWRMVAARRRYVGELALSSMPRLGSSLAEQEGVVSVDVGFDRDPLGTAFVSLRVVAELKLQCQRSLRIFPFPVQLDVRLGMIRDEAGEAALPPGYEPLLITAEDLSIRDLVEDELILALPVVPLSPGGSETPVWSDPEPDDIEDEPHPFAALAALKKPRP